MRVAATAALLFVAACGASTQPPAQWTAGPPSTLRGAAIRLAGELPTAPASAGPPGTIVERSYQVCLGDDARVASIKPVAPQRDGDDAVMAVLRGWSWFVLADRARPCFSTTLQLAVPAPSQIVRQAGGGGVMGAILHHVAVAPPRWLGVRFTGQTLDAMYKVCVDDTGAVQTVRPLVGVPGADEFFMAALRASSWSVTVGPLAQAPFCFGAPVRVDLSRARNGEPALPPPIPFPPDGARPEHGVSYVLRVTPTESHPPRLPDLFKIEASRRGVHKIVAAYDQCIRADGVVDHVEPLIRIPWDDQLPARDLQGWHFTVAGPPSIGVCYPYVLQYTIGGM